MSLTPDDIKEFIGEMWRIRHCPRCEHNAWTLPTEDEIKALVALVHDGAASAGWSQRALPVYFAICNNCGHVEWIATKVVRRWFEKYRGKRSE